MKKVSISASIRKTTDDLVVKVSQKKGSVYFGSKSRAIDLLLEMASEQELKKQ